MSIKTKQPLSRFLSGPDAALVKRALRYDVTLRNAEYDLAKIILKLDAKLENCATVLKHVRGHAQRLPRYLQIALDTMEKEEQS